MDLIEFIRDLYGGKQSVGLHEPLFIGNELTNVQSAIQSSYVSSVGKFVDEFETKIRDFTCANSTVATVNGTSALHASLVLSGVRVGDLVITQSVTFVATCNAILNAGARPIFVDISSESLGLCPVALRKFLEECAEIDGTECRLKASGQKITAVLPMHTFGHPVELFAIQNICQEWNLDLIEDAAEGLGSYYRQKHVGTIGRFGILSFNGNKIITSGGGGMILCRSKIDGTRAKHITTTAKVPHDYEYYHDEYGFNYRLPNLNAALGCAQLEMINFYLKHKRKLAQDYERYFEKSEFVFVKEPTYARSNYWLNAVRCMDKKHRDYLLDVTNSKGIMTRPVWNLMHTLPMFLNDLHGDLTVSEAVAETIVNIPSSVPFDNVLKKSAFDA